MAKDQKKQRQPVKDDSQSNRGIHLPPVKDFFQHAGKIAPWITLGIIAILSFSILKDYLLFNKVYFFKGVASDTYNCTYPIIYHIADYIRHYGVPGWSFNYGMGQSLFPFCLRDPFDLIFYVGGKDSILYGMAYKELIKIVLFFILSAGL